MKVQGVELQVRHYPYNTFYQGNGKGRATHVDHDRADSVGWRVFDGQQRKIFLCWRAFFSGFLVEGKNIYAGIGICQELIKGLGSVISPCVRAVPDRDPVFFGNQRISFQMFYGFFLLKGDCIWIGILKRVYYPFHSAKDSRKCLRQGLLSRNRRIDTDNRYTSWKSDVFYRVDDFLRLRDQMNAVYETYLFR